MIRYNGTEKRLTGSKVQKNTPEIDGKVWIKREYKTEQKNMRGFTKLIF